MTTASVAIRKHVCLPKIKQRSNALQEAGSAQVREALERLAQQNETLRAQLLEAETALLAEQEAVADLKQALAAAECCQATPLKADQAVQVRCDPLEWVWRGLHVRVVLISYLADFPEGSGRW